MPVTLVGVDRREKLWTDFLVSLSDEEKSVLFDGETELILHDEYVAGEIALVEIRLVLSSHPRDES